MMKSGASCLFLAVMLTFSSVVSAEEPSVGSYAIVVSSDTQSNPQWKKVVDALVAKHQGATIVTYDKQVKESLATLSKQHPRHTCFVATSTEADRQFVADVHRLTRRFDKDPYTDTLWGILTGYDAANALDIAKHNKPLTVRKVASGTEVALDMCTQGVWYDELVKNKKVGKVVEGDVKQEEGPADTTHALANTLSEYAADLFVTSGHATQRDWQIGFRYRNGQFRSQDGKMFGVTTKGERFDVRSDNPKVYLAIGNCLMGDINGPDAMALAWLNSVGVKQMVGYTVVTWYGYGGWGLLDYFIEQPGRYTLAEAFHVNHHALIHRLDTCFDDVVDAEFVVGSRRIPAPSPNQAGKKAQLTSTDSRGLLWDRDVVAFYGDPAWSARMASKTKAYGQTLKVAGDTYTLTITPNRGENSFKPINTNGAQRGWRPIVALLPHRVQNVKVIAGGNLQPVVTDDFVLIPNPRVCDTDREYRVVFSASRVE